MLLGYFIDKIFDICTGYFFFREGYVQQCYVCKNGKKNSDCSQIETCKKDEDVSLIFYLNIFENFYAHDILKTILQNCPLIISLFIYSSSIFKKSNEVMIRFFKNSN